MTPKPKRPMRARKVKPARVWLSPISGADGLYLAHDFQEQPYGDVVGVYELLVPIEKPKKRKRGARP